MRAFVALQLPEELREQVASLALRLSSRAEGRYVPRENYHLTLAFLGEVDEGGVSRVIAALDEACAGQPPIALVPQRLGHFGRKTDATLWMGVSPSRELSMCCDRIRAGFKSHCVAYDEKPFIPHVTLARRVDLSHGPLVEELDLPAVRASSVVLYRSQLFSSGAVYRPIYQIDLGAGMGRDCGQKCGPSPKT